MPVMRKTITLFSLLTCIALNGPSLFGQTPVESDSPVSKTRRLSTEDKAALQRKLSDKQAGEGGGCSRRALPVDRIPASGRRDMNGNVIPFTPKGGDEE